MSAAWEVGTKPSTGFGYLVERCQCVAEHGVEIQAGRRLVQSPESFHTIGIQLK